MTSKEKAQRVVSRYNEYYHASWNENIDAEAKWYLKEYYRHEHYLQLSSNQIDKILEQYKDQLEG